MAETNWIFNLIDRATAPMKQFMSSVFGAKDAIDDLSRTSEFSAKETENAIKSETDNRKRIIHNIKEQEKALSELERTAKRSNDYATWSNANRELPRAKRHLEELNKELKDSNADIKTLNEHLDKLNKPKEMFSNMALGFNQFSELAEKVSKSLDFTVNIARTRDNIQRMTGATGSALDDVTQRVHTLGKTFDENDDKIALAANAMASQMSVSYNEALELIEKGYDKGANLNGDMLQMLQQYAPKLHEMGLTASESIALMAQAGKQGIPVDKAVDAINKANDAIKERSPATIKALEGIGIDVKNLADKTAFEAQQMIGKAMSGATEQQKASVLKQVFKESGQRAGSGFVEGIASVDMNVDNMPSVVEAGTGFKKVIGDIEGWVANATGNMGIYVKQFVGAAAGLNNVVGLFASLSKVTWAQNLMQNALNITTGIFNTVAKAGPWGWIGLAISGVTLLIGYLSDKFEWAAGIVGGVKNSFLGFGKVLLDVVLLPIKMILSSVGALGNAIAKLFSGDFSGAWTAAKSAINPIKDLVKDTKDAAAAYKAGSDDAITAFREKKASDENALTTAGDGPDAATLGLPTIDENKNKNAKAKDGLSISGAGGVKAITMNLEIKNYFNNVKGNARELANQIAGQVNDRLRDALVAQ